MSNYLVHDASGRILRQVQCPEHMAALQAQPGEYVVPGAADDEAYFVDPLHRNIKPRPSMPVTLNKATFQADGVDSIIISDIPYGVTVYVDSEPFFVNDGVFEFTAALPGPYWIRIEGFPYQSTEFEVLAV